ncbi:hypothetical protein [Streptomyces sp. HC307]|uniref:hypothetical protein n=1 Tax=Streptomyces flavusporus TaxID=3385496 RepID=UPI003917619B
MSSSSQNPDRDAYIAGLRQLADWLEQHPDIAVPYVKEISVPLTTNQRVAEFATAAGVGVETDEDGNAKATVQFGLLTYYGFGYADFPSFNEQLAADRARSWAERNDMVIQPREGGAR